MHGAVQRGRVAEEHFAAGVGAREVWLGDLLVVVVRVVGVIVVRLRHAHEGVDAGGGRQQLDGERGCGYSATHRRPWRRREEAGQGGA